MGDGKKLNKSRGEILCRKTLAGGVGDGGDDAIQRWTMTVARREAIVEGRKEYEICAGDLLTNLKFRSKF